MKILELDGYFALDAKGRKKRIQEAGWDVVLATFRATPRAAASLDSRAWWDDVKPGNPDHERPPEAPIPYFRLTFAGRGCGKPEGAQEIDPASQVFHIPLDKAGEEEDGFEIGYVIEDSAGNIQAAMDCDVARLLIPRCHLPRAQDAALLCSDFAVGRSLEMWLQDQYSAARTDASVTPSLRQRAQEREERAHRAAKQAMADLDRYLDESDSSYAAHVRNYREYQHALKAFQDVAEKHRRAPDRDKETLAPLLHLRRQELEERKQDLDEYLSTSGAIPPSYREQAEAIRKARERNRALDEFLSHPITRVITLLPGMGVVTAVTQIAQGKYLEAFTSVGLDLLSAGSFSKLSRMATLFSQAARQENGSLAALLGYRYLQASLGKAGKLDTLFEITSRVDPGFARLYGVVKGFKSLRSQGDSVVNLLKSRKSIAGAVGLLAAHPIKNGKEFITALKQADLYEDFLLAMEFFQTYRKAKALEKKMLLLVDHEKPGNETGFIHSLQEALKELRSLSDHAHILPSAGEARTTADTVERLIDHLAGKNIDISDVLDLIPSTDVVARIHREKPKTLGRDGDGALMSGRVDATREDLAALLERVKKGFEIIVPSREKELRSKGLDNFLFWNPNACQWNYNLEVAVEKLADQVEAKAMMMGLDYHVKGWLNGIVHTEPSLPGKWWIVQRGHCEIGISLCESLLEHL